MVTIYHNPRCKKSREGLAILEALDIKFNVRKYLDERLTIEELKNIIDVNCSLEYKINNVFSSYLTAKNLIGGYQLWHNYSVLGPQIQVGITYRY